MIEPGTVVRHDFAIRNLTVSKKLKLSPGLVRVTVTGDELDGFISTGPTDHSKLYFPHAETGTITAPRVTPDGVVKPESGTVIARDYTPRAFRPRSEEQEPELDFDFVLHGDDGPAAAWAESVEPGAQIVVGGPRGSRTPPTGATRFILAADETALPALARWIESLAEDIEIVAFAELSNESDAAYLEPAHVHRARVLWLAKGDGALERAIRNYGPIDEHTFVWAAGEAASLIPIRRYLRRELGLPASQVKIDGYWKAGEAGRDHHAPIDPADPED